MALRDWDRWGSSDKPGGWSPKKGLGWVYFYPKGWFRGKEDKYVISISSTGGSNPADRRNVGFKTKAQALRFARSYMRKHK